MILSPNEEALRRAAEHLRAGELVAFPTETVYGLGADATNAAAVARVFAVKDRPFFDPLIVHVDSLEMLVRLGGSIPSVVVALAERFWPGPLTLLVPRAESIPEIVTAGLPSMAVRIPDHPIALELIARAGGPIAAPSANPFGYISPTTAEHVSRQLGGRVAIILDGGACRVGVESTIVSVENGPPCILRPGGLALEELEAVLGPVNVVSASDRPVVPGQLPRHYSPRVPLLLIDTPGEVPPEEREGAALLAPGPVADRAGFAHVEQLSPTGEMTTVAVHLFAALRRLDDERYRRIYAIRVEEIGLGRAILDRLQRASEPQG